MTQNAATDPVFISYRQSDGTEVTTELAWLLRAAGIPVWRDRDDLPPGDTKQRLEEAIDAGISGAALVITPEISESWVVRDIEAPRLLGLHAGRPEFALGICNAVSRPDGGVDYIAPDALLALDPDTLSGVDQQRADREGLRALVRKMLWHRMAEQRELVSAEGGTFALSVQTRNTPQVYDRTGSQLDIRVRPSAHPRLPHPDGLRDLMDTIGLLPDAVTRTAAVQVKIRGGAHLSVAFAIGAALPSTRVGPIVVVDQEGVSWASGSAAIIGPDPRLRVAAERRTGQQRNGRAAAALYVDLTPQPSGAAFDRFLEENTAEVQAWRHIVAGGVGGLLDAADAGTVAAEVAAHIRALSYDNGNAVVHVLLRCPFPIAVLTGRLTNTVVTVLYEWDDSDPVAGDDFRPRYVPTLMVRTSAPTGVIKQVLSI